MFTSIQEENLNIGSDRRAAIPGSSEVKFPKNISDKFHSLRFHAKRHNSYSSLYSNLILENTKKIEKIENDDQNKPIIPMISLKSPKITNFFKENNDLSSPESPVKKNQLKKMYGLISKLLLTKKFLRKLRNATVYRRPQWFKRFHYNIINDLSFFYEGTVFKNERLGRFFLVIHNCFKKVGTFLITKVEVLNPSSNFYILYNIFILILSIMCLILIPLKTSFDFAIYDESIKQKVSEISLWECFFLIF